MTYVALLPLAGRETSDKAGEIAGLVERSGLPLADARFLIIGSEVPPLPLGVVVSLLRPAVSHAEPNLAMVADLVRRSGARLVLMPDDGAGRAFAARLALMLGAHCLTAVNALTAGADGWSVRRRSHAGRLDALFKFDGRPLVATVARGIEPTTLPMVAHSVDVVIDAVPPADWLADAIFTPSALSSGLEQAEAVLIAGRGAGSRAGVDRLARVAARLGMAFAVSRPVVMNAWAPLDRLAGVSGAMLKPRLCLLAGVSGAPALMAAVSRARTLVAINTDPAAPVFRQVDVGIVGDCLTLLEAFADRTSPETPN